MFHHNDLFIPAVDVQVPRQTWKRQTGQLVDELAFKKGKLPHLLQKDTVLS